MRAACVDRRRFQLLTTTRTNAAQVPVGTPVSTSWFTGENGPNDLPVWRTQMVDPAPAGGWSWGSNPGYQFPVLPAGTAVRVWWWMRASSVPYVQSISIVKSDGLLQAASKPLTDTLQWTKIIWEVQLSTTTRDHQLRLAMAQIAGFWVDMTPPLIEIVGP